ncbi:MAG TPA: hypothetical protein VFR11_04225 [Micromonosporaceae bacterium]|jgi:hypothetical protein|nr:hypothetical protein [Micromonosporaceae bacterium]
MRALRGFLLFWYDFVVGDDATIAAGVVVAIALTAVLAHQDVVAWWLLPVAVALLLAASLHRAARTSRRGGS